MNKSIPATVIVMTMNEERNLAKCLRSVAQFAQVFVVDSNSTDTTRAIAESFGARVIPFVWNGRYPKKKQWCLENLPFEYDWVLYLDADEELTPEGADEIADVLDVGPRYAAYFAGYNYVFLGRVLKHGHRIYKLVLLDRRRARFPELPDLEVGTANEVEPHYQPEINGTTGVLHKRIIHDDHDDLFHYFDRHNRYSDWEALLRNKGFLPRNDEPQPGARGVLKRVFARLPCKGSAAAVYSYALRLGFLDGSAGLQFAIGRGCYYWQVGLKQKELRRRSAQTDAHQ